MADKIKEMKRLLHEKNWDAAFAYELFIRKQAELGNKIPGRVLKKYFDLFILDLETDPEIKKLVNSKAEEIFKAFPKINYAGQKKRLVEHRMQVEGKFVRVPHDHPNYKEEYQIIDFDIKEALVGICHTIQILLIEDKDNLNKDECIRIAYNRLDSFRRSFLAGKDFEDFSEYKIGVLSSFIAVAFGFTISTKKLTKSILYHASRHAIQKAKQQRSDDD